MFSKGLKAQACPGGFTYPGNCSSSAECGTYDIGYDDDQFNRLTNKIDGDFTISELEVWEITGCIVDGEFLKYNKEEINRIRN